MRITVRKLTLMAALTAAALIIFIIEAQIPIPLPIPSVKLGFANIVTLFALFFADSNNKAKLTTADVFLILLCRIILGAVFTGRVTAFFYSLAGGLLSFTGMAVVRRFLTVKQIWVCGVIGAVLHNVGQILAAMLITGTPSIAVYLPVLIVAAVVTGIFTGLIAQMTVSGINGRIK